MSATDLPKTPEELGQALLAALEAPPFEKLNRSVAQRVGQQILSLDMLREIDADEAKTKRLLAVRRPEGLSAIFYGFTLFDLAEKEGLKGFLYRKAGREAAIWLLGMPIKWILEGKDSLVSDELVEEALGIAQAVGAIDIEAMGLLALGFCYYARQQQNEAVGALHDGLLLVPRAEAQAPADDRYVISDLKQLTDKAARTLLTLMSEFK